MQIIRAVGIGRMQASGAEEVKDEEAHYQERRATERRIIRREMKS